MIISRYDNLNKKKPEIGGGRTGDKYLFVDPPTTFLGFELHTLIHSLPLDGVARYRFYE